jgi:hypothetical protein
MAEEPKPDTLMVFSGKSLNTMINEGGCGHWVVDQDRARRRGYLIAVRNHHAPWSEYDVPHGVAWLVATIVDVVPSPEGGRWIVKLGKYAIVEKQRDWVGRNPVAYTRLESLGIDPGTLEWKSFPAPADAQVPAPLVPPQPALGSGDDAIVRPLTFDQAKQGLALSMGVRPEQIEITIRA